jgi:hypothetical protein
MFQFLDVVHLVPHPSSLLASVVVSVADRSVPCGWWHVGSEGEGSGALVVGFYFHPATRITPQDRLAHLVVDEDG